MCNNTTILKFLWKKFLKGSWQEKSLQKTNRSYQAFLKTNDQATTYHLTNRPLITDQPTTDQMRRPATNRPPTKKKSEDQKFENKF